MDVYEKTEIIRQAVDMVKKNASKQRTKRESRDMAYSGTRSRVRGNMKSIERAKNVSHSPVKRYGPEHSFIEGMANEMSVSVTDLTVTVKGEYSPVRLHKDPQYIELRKQMEENIELTEQYK